MLDASSSNRNVTLLEPAARSRPPRTASWSLPADLLGQAAARLRILALLYAFVFFMAAFVPVLASPERARLFDRFSSWGPGAISITVAIVLAAVIGHPRVPLPVVMLIGLIFEVVSSYGIAAAQYLGGSNIDSGAYFGLSWVAVWTLLFTVVIPTPPRRAVAASLAAVSSVPVVIGFAIRSNIIKVKLAPEQFFFGLVFPYLLIVVMAYVGARVVFSLGTEIRRARELGSYQLERRLGEGGMGEVWRARHRLLAREAAIKLIRPALADHGRSETRKRFEREAHAIASLRSPHTVNLFDFGVAADGAFYYVMELLDGLDLDQLVRQHGPMSPARAIFILRQVCHSLSEADSIGLVHRDIKPANILVCRYGQDADFVKVLDFGLVKTMNDSTEAPADITRENAVHGTPSFIAPEQARGASQVDGRTDIYATGCVAYWLLTGQTVFTSKTAMALLLDHVSTTPQPPSTRTEQPIPPELDALVLACLEKDPNARPQSASELSRRLGEVPVAEPWTETQAREWWATHVPKTVT